MLRKYKLSILFVMIALGAIVLFHAETSPAQPTQAVLQITQPADNTIVAPGQIVKVVVTPAAGTSITTLAIIGEDPLPTSQILTGPPFEFSYTIPSNIPLRKYHITAFASGQSNVIQSTPVTLVVDQSNQSTNIRVEPQQIRFQFAGEQIPLRVVGTFVDGAVLDITESPTTSYTSTDNAVALVDSIGVVTAVGSGGGITTATIVVKYRTQAAGVQVSVPRLVVGDLNGDGKVDQNDLNLILDSLGSPASGPFDAHDLNHDGKIDSLDAKQFMSLCTSHCNNLNIPPDVSNARPSVATLWPPNHQMVTVSILGVTDADSDPFTISIDQIGQDEATTGMGAGDACPDGQGVGKSFAQLRAERSGTGVGRMYTIFFTATDVRGGASSGTVKVCVPRDQSSACQMDQLTLDSTICGP